MTLLENWLLDIPASGTTEGFLSGERWAKGSPSRTAKMREWRKEKQLSQSRTRPEGLGLREKQRNQKNGAEVRHPFTKIRKNRRTGLERKK